MAKMFKYWKLLIAIFGMLAAVAAIGFYLRAPKLLRTNVQSTETTQKGGGLSEAQYVTNLADDKKLVGIYHNVFVGKVLEQTRYDGRTAMTQIWYLVEVVLNIKGNLMGVITVNLFPGGNGLKVGATYVFATGYTKQENEYSLGAPEYDHSLISEDPSLSIHQLQVLAEQDKRFKQLKAAYPNEILFKGDLKNGTTYNSYASRHYDASGELIDDTVELAKQHAAAAGEPIASSEPSLDPTTVSNPPIDTVSPTPEPSPEPTPAENPAPEAS